MKPHILIFAFSIINLLRFSYCSNCTIVNSLICRKQTNCLDCIRVHSCCNWCYKASSNGYSCDLKDALSNCEYMEENQKTVIISNVTLKKQISPQSYKVVLRKDETLKLTVTYQAERDYPLELYYLTDLSYSMRDYVETLKSLGDKLRTSLSSLTKNYKLAYGSFLDKPGMPFTLTDPDNFKNPCNTEKLTCDSTYLFKHTLNFTRDANEFFKAVTDSRISANLDDLDGALEAIQQVLLCDETLGWTKESRKLIVLSTDSLLHSAGDGILVGATKFNPGKCLIDQFGEHIDPLTYDYPSIAEIRSLLRKYKVNLIVAVQEKEHFYQSLKNSTLQKEMYVGRLKNASDILQLVTDGFQQFIRQVEFSTDTSDIPELDVKFFSDCNEGSVTETTYCQNIDAYQKIDFNVELTLKEWVSDSRNRKIIIREKNINEDVTIDIAFPDKCSCINLDAALQNLNCNNGIASCGKCVCNKGWKGDRCNEECLDSVAGCIERGTTNFCSGKGDCVCGKCECSEPYEGTYCEYECPTDDYGRKCGDRGTCINGTCTCNLDYSGYACTCHESTDRCKFGSDVICQRNGVCECNKCNCYTGYSGTYCERENNKNTFCDDIQDSVLSASGNVTMATVGTISNVTLILKSDSTKECLPDQSCIYIKQLNAEKCYVKYCYEISNNNNIIINTQPKNNMECSITTQAMSSYLAIAIFSAIVAVGIAYIILKKWRIYKLDQAEYLKYEEMRLIERQEENPLYNSPYRKYSVPK
ncbi:integrin beta-nu-like isoform X1 [Rhynchophorus ferrugineus]|uniref:integrin beta-nu-like isoform X1 n=2 Tax=Rhynchophorus ferrugineus TaxID=354439 RepID=UPI003FCDE012